MGMEAKIITIITILTIITITILNHVQTLGRILLAVWFIYNSVPDRQFPSPRGPQVFPPGEAKKRGFVPRPPNSGDVAYPDSGLLAG